MPDYSIASMLNRLSKRTAKGHTWTAARIRTLRSDHRIDVYRDGERAQRAEVNLDEAAKELGVSKMTVLRMIERAFLQRTRFRDGADRFGSARDSHTVDLTAEQLTFKVSVQIADRHGRQCPASISLWRRAAAGHRTAAMCLTLESAASCLEATPTWRHGPPGS